MAIDEVGGLSYMVVDGIGYVFRDKRAEPIAKIGKCFSIEQVEERYLATRYVHRYHQQPISSKPTRGIFGRRMRPNEIIVEMNKRFSI